MMLLPRAVGFCLLASLVVVRAATRYSVRPDAVIECANSLDSVCWISTWCNVNGQVDIDPVDSIVSMGVRQPDGVWIVRGGYTITFPSTIYFPSSCYVKCQGDCVCDRCSNIVEVADFDTSTMTADAEDDNKPNAAVISLISVASVFIVAIVIFYVLGSKRCQCRNRANVASETTANENNDDDDKSNDDDSLVELVDNRASVAPETMDDENNDDGHKSDDDDSLVELVDALVEDDRPSRRDARAVVGRIGRPFCKSGGNAWKWLSLGLTCVVIILVVLLSTSTKAKNRECFQDAGCGGNMTCELSEADANAPMMCCLHGNKVTGFLGNGEFATVCTDRPVGTYCHEMDIMCSSGLCIHSICASDHLADQDPCNKNADCKSNKCVHSSAEPDSSMICCSETLQLDSGMSVCTSLPFGSRCDDLDHACASGLCINGRCADEALEVNQLCDTRSHCKSGACGLAAADLDSLAVCCESGDTFYDYVHTVLCMMIPEANSSTNSAGACQQEHTANLVIPCVPVGSASMKPVLKKDWTTMQPV